MRLPIDHIFYINLDKRTDRRKHIENVLSTYGLEAERFSAIARPDQGILGCGLSHLAVLKLAKERNYKNVLIFEDDFTFLVSPQFFREKITQLFSSDIPFDVCMLAYNLRESSPVEPDFLLRALVAHTASAYIVQHHYYDKLIQLYEWAMPLLEKTGEHWNYANDMVWQTLQRQDQWFVFRERIGKQIDGYSDNSYCYRAIDC
jgi:glycosyl transferase family 25